MKQRTFIMKYQDFYSRYNRGKSGKQRKKGRTLGNKKMRNTLKKEVKLDYGCEMKDMSSAIVVEMEDTYA
jgi:hypothetical protein